MATMSATDITNSITSVLGSTSLADLISQAVSIQAANDQASDAATVPDVSSALAPLPWAGWPAIQTWVLNGAAGSTNITWLAANAVAQLNGNQQQAFVLSLLILFKAVLRLYPSAATGQAS